MSELSPLRRVATATIGLLSAGALSGCGVSMLPDHTPKKDTDGAVEYTVSSGFVSTVENQGEYPYVRENPTKKVDGDGLSTNDCAQLNITFPYGATEVWIKSGDPNGPYVGYSLEDMPDYVQEACASDQDGIVWVTDEAVVQNITAAINASADPN